MSAPFIIGGGEIIQSVWFELKGLGAKSPNIITPIVTVIGSNLNCSVDARNSVFDTAWDTGTFAYCNDDNKEEARAIFLRAFERIYQFLQTNVPTVCGATNGITLGYSGGSFTILTS